MAEQTIKIGIVGAGIWGRNHALVLATHPRAKSSSAIAMKVALGRWQGIVKLTIFGCSTLGMWGMRSLRGGTNRMEWGYKPATSLRVQ
jgi:hypothetical protein